MNGWDCATIIAVALVLLIDRLAPVIATDRAQRRRHAKDMAALTAAPGPGLEGGSR